MRYCPLVLLMIYCASGTCLADATSSTLTIPLSLPNQAIVEAHEEDRPINYSFDGQPIDKQSDKNWFIAGGSHYTITEAKQKQDSRKSRCLYYKQLHPQVLALSSAPPDDYAYRNFVQAEIKFFCGMSQ